MVGKVYGIDLGTTTSCIACVDEHGKPEIVNNSEGQPTTPSVVWFTEDGTAVVGQNAKHESVVHPDRVVSLVKRVMGNADWLFSCNGKSYKPQEISAHILRKLVNDAQNERGDEIKDVVITCPAYFGVNEREATRQAGQIAGLNVLQIIPEPTAAALAYGMGQERDQVVMVYDLGGGTFDVTVIDVKDKHLRVVAVGGNHRLGGADWDSVIVTYFEQEFERQKNISVDVLERNLETRQQLLNEAERTKIGLSTVNKRDYRIRHEAESAMVSLTREKLDEFTAPLLDMTIGLTKGVLERGAEKGFKKIDTLLLVGGSTYMPQVEDRLRREFPSSRILRQEPNLIVAKGAALFGYKLQIDKEILNRIGDLTGAHPDSVDLDRVATSVKNQAQQSVAIQHGMALPDLRRLHEKKITNVTAKSFGLKTWDVGTRHEFITNLVIVNDAVPKTFTVNRFTLDHGQSGVDLQVYENISRTGPEERLNIDKCTLIGQAFLRFQRPLPANSEIEVTFDLSPDSLLRVHGRDLTTSAEVSAEFRTEGAMTPQELDGARTRAMAMPVS